MHTIALTGNGGRLAAMADIVIAVPSADTQYIQEAHLAVEHILCELVEFALFREPSVLPENSVDPGKIQDDQPLTFVVLSNRIIRSSDFHRVSNRVSHQNATALQQPQLVHLLWEKSIRPSYQRQPLHCNTTLELECLLRFTRQHSELIRFSGQVCPSLLLAIRE